MRKAIGVSLDGTIKEATIESKKVYDDAIIGKMYQEELKNHLDSGYAYKVNGRIEYVCEKENILVIIKDEKMTMCYIPGIMTLEQKVVFLEKVLSTDPLLISLSYNGDGYSQLSGYDVILQEIDYKIQLGNYRRR